MSALTTDIKIMQYGTPDLYPPVVQPIGAGVQLYRGSIALTNGPNSSVNPGYLKNAKAPTSTDVCWGVLEMYDPTCGAVDSIPGLLGGSTNGATRAQIRQGSFFFKSGSGADQLSQSTVGQTVYVIDEQTMGATNGSGTRPAAGVHEAVDPTQPSTLFAVSLGNAQSSGSL
jgi:hypothetical protein